MTLFFGDWEFPSQENTIETCEVFADYLIMELKATILKDLKFFID